MIGGKKKKKDGSLDMKKVFIFGRFTRVLFLVDLLFFLGLTFDKYISNGFLVEDLLLLLLLLSFTICCCCHIYSSGVFVDTRNNRVTISFGWFEKDKHARPLGAIKSLGVERKGDTGFYFVVNYKNGYSERIYYSFYRLSLVEKMQFRRINKELSKLKL